MAGEPSPGILLEDEGVAERTFPVGSVGVECLASARTAKGYRAPGGNGFAKQPELAILDRVQSVPRLAHELHDHEILFVTDTQNHVAVDAIVKRDYWLGVYEPNRVVEEIGRLHPNMVINDCLRSIFICLKLRSNFTTFNCFSILFLPPE